MQSMKKILITLLLASGLLLTSTRSQAFPWIPAFFVATGMGGLMVMQKLKKAVSDRADAEAKVIAEAVAQVTKFGIFAGSLWLMHHGTKWYYQPAQNSLKVQVPNMPLAPQAPSHWEDVADKYGAAAIGLTAGAAGIALFKRLTDEPKRSVHYYPQHPNSKRFPA